VRERNLFRSMLSHDIRNPLNIIFNYADMLSEEAQLSAAGAAVRGHPELIAGVSLGSELLFSRRGDREALTRVITRLRARLPGTPLSVSEPFHVYGQEAVAPLLGELDFLLPIVHPLFQPWFRGASPGTAAQFVVNVVHTLEASYCGPILVKETGVPSAPAGGGFSEIEAGPLPRPVGPWQVQQRLV